MSSETIEVKKRDALGSNAVKHLRREGKVPAILYGHGEENVNLAVCSDALNLIIKHGTKLLSLTGEITETAILRDVQWDTFGVEILHVDFARVSQSEAVEVTLPVELHGEAPGLSEGGILDFHLHELTILCPAAEIPDHIHINVSQLHLGKAIHANEVTLPAGAKMVTHGSEVVVQISAPSGDDSEGAAGAGEPELIRKEKATAGADE